MTRHRRVILVTGTPRSGTTPVGNALAVASGARTLYEPLNFHVGDRRVRRYFEVVGAGGFEASTLDDLVSDITRLRLRLRPGIFPEDRGIRLAVKRITGSRTRATYLQCRLDPRLRTLVWKDPFAALMTAELAERHGLPVVATVRPPHAVAASFKRLGWAFDVEDVVERLGDAGRAHRHLLEQVDHRGPVGNAIVLWHIVNDRLLQAAVARPEVRLVDMDRFIRDRPAVLRALYDDLDLAWSPRVDRHLAVGGSSRSDTDLPGRAHVSGRDPSTVNTYWDRVLDDAEAALVSTVNDELWGRVSAASS